MPGGGAPRTVVRKAKCLWGGSSQDSREESKMPVGGGGGELPGQL